MASVNLWSVFATGLVSGGASCVAVQGGLLAGAVARGRSAVKLVEVSRPKERDERVEAVVGPDGRSAEVETVGGGVLPGRAEPNATDKAPEPSPDPTPWPAPRSLTRTLTDDAAPVGGFLFGKLLSHVAFGALLGLFGQALQPNFRVRSGMQIGAGALMVLMAANLAGLLGKRSFVPAAPMSLQRLVRRSARVETAFGPALLGFLTVLLPCGVTLSVEFLVIASGSPITGAAAMGLFVLGTSPLFAVFGYAMRRATTVLRGHLTKLAALVVAVAGLLSINSGLALRGSQFTLAKVAPGVSAAVPAALGGGRAATEGLSGKPLDDKPLPLATVGADGVQVVEIHVFYGDMAGGATPYEPTVVQAKAGIPTQLKLVATNALGCAGVIVVQGRGIERALTANTETVIDLGVLDPGIVGFTCGIGMYGGAINVVA